MSRWIGKVPPPLVDCTAVVESPARKNAGGFAFGAAIAEDVKVAMAARSGNVEKCILIVYSGKTVHELQTRKIDEIEYCVILDQRTGATLPYILPHRLLPYRHFTCACHHP